MKNTIGVGENHHCLAQDIVIVNGKEKENSGDCVFLKSPCVSSARFYQVLAMNEDDLYLVKDLNVKMKDNRRQIVSTTVYNLTSHIAAVACVNFIQISEKWNA